MRRPHRLLLCRRNINLDAVRPASDDSRLSRHFFPDPCPCAGAGWSHANCALVRRHYASPIYPSGNTGGVCMPTLNTSPLRNGASPTGEGISLLAAWGGIRRRMRLILWTLLVVNLMMVGAVLLISPRYTATSTLMIDPGGLRVLEGRNVAKGVPEPIPGDNSVMATQINLLRSPSLAVQVITALGLER